MMVSLSQTPTTHFVCAQTLEALGEDEKAMFFYHKVLKNKKSSSHYIFDAANRLIELRKKLDAVLINAFQDVLKHPNAYDEEKIQAQKMIENLIVTVRTGDNV